LADGTGGKFFHNRNDVDAAMREAGAAPAFSYLLGFSPQNLKMMDGSHPEGRAGEQGKIRNPGAPRLLCAEDA